ncbi:MAG: hypothetical protein HY569_00275 [Candidatus Magasanikbacteria bacterium]|nr:hypothetical protein [Candidatus Magasanikbacteria bacterium]
MRFFRILKQFRLTAEEKNKSRDFLLARMGLDSVRIPSLIRHSFWKVPLFPAFLTNKHMIATLIAAIVLAFSGGAAAAAESSLPGDILYPVKVKINEEVKSAFSLSAEAKAAWDARRAERRLEEAEKLAVADKLTAPTSEQLAERFHKYAEKMEARLERLEESGKLSPAQVDDLKTNFEASLKAHAEVIAQMQERERARLLAVRDALRDQASSTIRLRLEREEKLVSAGDESTTSTRREAAEGRRNAAVNKIAEVEKFINDNSNKVTAEVKAEAVAKLDEAKAELAEGGKDLAEGRFGEALIKFSRAHRDAQEAKLYFVARFRLRFVLAGDSASSIPPLMVSSTELKDSLKDLEEKLHEELKAAQEKRAEMRKEGMEKLKDERPEKSNGAELKINVSAAAGATL